MTIRRHCDPFNVQAIWNAIQNATHSKQMADANKISRYLQKSLECTPAESTDFIKQCVKDKLIVGNARNSSTLSYKIPTQGSSPSDGKDWYCFECHLAGEVTACLGCFRVFHAHCSYLAKNKFDQQKNQTNYPKTKEKKIVEINNSSDSSICLVSDDEEPKSSSTETADYNKNVASSSHKSNEDKINKPFEKSLCSACNMDAIDYSCDLDKEEINRILRFVLNRIRAWLPENITHKISKDEKLDWLTEKDLTWRANHLFVEHVDMSTINVKLKTETYSKLSEFLTDVYTIQHNVAIFHGIDSQEYEASELVLRDTLHDLTEIRNCVDCYRSSNEKINSKWFSIPCQKPHEVVWAKQKGYPHWPAKVMKSTETHYDVRFFGGKYERAFLEKKFVKPIGTPKHNLQIKSSIGFNKACEEMKLYLNVLNKPSEVEKLRTPSPKRPKSRLGNRRKSVHQPDLSNHESHNESGVVSAEAKSSTETKRRALLKRRHTIVTMEDMMDKKIKTSENHQRASTPQISGNVIDISDCEDEPFSFNANNSKETVINLDDACVSSSTENGIRNVSPRREQEMQTLDQIYNDAVEKMRRKMEFLSDKSDIIMCAMDCMQTEIDNLVSTHTEYVKNMVQQHRKQISDIKKKQWCYYCEQDAIYHCCWNTAYCSFNCQQQHWQTEHKKVCRRKR